jgi:hypothetical protein
MKRYDIPQLLTDYTNSRTLDLKRYSEYHFRIFDTAATLDVWTTGKYYIRESNYGHGIIERGGEKGHIPRKRKKAYEHLDRIFYAVEIAEAKNDPA